MTYAERVAAATKKAAIFLHSDPGNEGWLSRLAIAVEETDPSIAAQAKNRAFEARDRAGHIALQLGGSSVYYLTDRAEGSPEAAIFSASLSRELRIGEDILTVGVMLGDSHGPIPDMAVQVTFRPSDETVVGVTDVVGYMTATALGSTVSITFGDQES